MSVDYYILLSCKSEGFDFFFFIFPQYQKGVKRPFQEAYNITQIILLCTPDISNSYVCSKHHKISVQYNIHLIHTLFL